MALRRIMEKYTANTRFCIIANYTHKLSPALLSRCTRFRFSPLKKPDIRRIVDMVVEKENVVIQPKAIESLVELSKGDMRRALNVLQACHASSRCFSLPSKSSFCFFVFQHVLIMSPHKGTPLPVKGAKPSKPAKPEPITEATIYTCIAAPHPADIQALLSTLMDTSDTTACLTAVRLLQTERGIALADVVTALAAELTELKVPPQTRITWLEGLAAVESRLAGGGNEVVQAGGLVGVVRGGVEVMEMGGFGKGS